MKHPKAFKTYTFKVVVESDGDGWFIYSPALEGIGGAIWGPTQEEALAIIQKVVEGYIKTLLKHNKPIRVVGDEDVLITPKTEIKIQFQIPEYF